MARLDKERWNGLIAAIKLAAQKHEEIRQAQGIAKEERMEIKRKLDNVGYLIAVVAESHQLMVDRMAALEARLGMPGVLGNVPSLPPAPDQPFWGWKPRGPTRRQ